MPEGLKSIYLGAFAGNPLEEVSLPSSIEQLGQNTFGDKLKLIKPVSLEQWVNIEYINQDGGPLRKNDLILDPSELIEVGPYTASYDLEIGGEIVRNLVVPGTINKINNFAFYYSNIETVTFEEGVTEIGNYSFDYCNRITELSIPAHINNFCSFSHCNSLKKVTLEEGVIRITGGLKDCVSLKELILPSTINYCNFNDMFESLNSSNHFPEHLDIYLYASKPPVFQSFIYSFTTVPDTVTLHVPAESVEAYKKAKGWRLFPYIEALP